MTCSTVCTIATCFSRSRYTGKERDAESGNDYFGTRYYASSMGRFLSPDPSGLFFANPTNPQSFNLYSYAGNNPLRFIDPSGLVLCDYGQNDDGSEDYEDADDENECTSNGGTVVQDQQSINVNATPSDDIPVTTIESCYQLALPYPGNSFSLAASDAAQGGAYSVSPQAYASPTNPFSLGFATTTASAANMTGNFLAGTGPTYTDFGTSSPESMAMAESTLVREAIGNYLQNGFTSGTGNFEQYGLGPVGAGANPTAQFVGGFTYTIVPFGGTLYMQIYNETSRSSLAYHMASSIPRNGTGPFPPMSTTIQTYDIAVPCP